MGAVLRTLAPGATLERQKEDFVYFVFYCIANTSKRELVTLYCNFCIHLHFLNFSVGPPVYILANHLGSFPIQYSGAGSHLMLCCTL